MLMITNVVCRALIAGKTRTKDKYRTVYSESQRLELERLYTSAAYIPTSDRKNAIARSVGLTDRQVKIWFQNRRAKERKDRRKTESGQNNQQQQHQQPLPCHQQQQQQVLCLPQQQPCLVSSSGSIKSETMQTSVVMRANNLIGSLTQRN